MKRRNISAIMKQIYGTGNFNPRRFDRRPRSASHLAYLWGLIFFLFAIIAVMLIGVFLFGGTPDSFTGERVVFELVGSENPKTAAKEEYMLKITNGEEVALEDLELFIDWNLLTENEDGSSAVHFISSELPPDTEANNTWKLGKIGVGETKDFAFSARFVGPSGAKVLLPFSFTLRPSGFTSTFVVDHSETFTLGDSTIGISLNSPSFVLGGSPIKFEILISGDSLAFGDISKLVASFDAPQSFSATISDPEIEDGSVQGEWIVAALPRQGDAYKIAIEGILEGEIGTEHKFSASLSRKDSLEEIAREEKTIMIQSADASVALFATPANGKKLQWGERVGFSLEVKNTSEYVMRNVVVSASSPDDMLWKPDSLEIQDNGFFESGKFIWDAMSTKALESIRPGDSVALKFGFATSEAPEKDFEGPRQLIVKASASAKIGERELAIESEELKVNILAEVDFDITAWYKDPEGAVVGEGPHPPIYGQETVYEILFQLGPISSGLKDLELSAKAGSAVVWKNDANYSVGELSFDGGSGLITWRAARVPRIDIPMEVKFKIGVNPSSQLASGAVLMEAVKLFVVDANAGEEMEFFGGNITLGDVE